MVDKGCQHHDRCLTCPFPVCVEDDPFRPEFRSESYKNSRLRTAAVKRDLRKGRLMVKDIATKYSITPRTVHRINRSLKKVG